MEVHKQNDEPLFKFFILQKMNLDYGFKCKEFKKALGRKLEKDFRITD